MLGPSPTVSEHRLGSRTGEDVDFVSRMSSLPIVNTALRAYEQGKASSRVVKVCVLQWRLGTPYLPYLCSMERR